MNVAKAIDGIPVTQSTAERDALFPVPATDQRVFNKATFAVERYDGAVWVTDFGAVAGAGAAGAILYSDGTKWVRSAAALFSAADAYAGTGTATTGAPRLFFGTNAPSGDDSAILIGRAIAGNLLFSHAVRDESTFTSTGSSAYASFDSNPVMTGAAAYNHFRSFQSRPNFAGSTSISEVNGFQWNMTHSGTGVIGNCYGIHIVNPAGAGPITNNVGIWIEDLTRGSGSNYAIFSAGTAPSFHGGKWQLGTTADLVLGKFTGTYGQLLSVDASGFVLGNPNLTIINGVLDFAATNGQANLRHSGNNVWGIGYWSTGSKSRVFSPDGTVVSIGKMSNADGTTYTENTTFDANTGDVNLVNGVLKKAGTQLLGARKTGWTVQTTALARADMGATPTLATVASTLAALINDFHGTGGHGAIGT